jgi:hypothetical protein
MQANAAQFDVFAFDGRCAQQPWKPRERNAKRPSVGQIDPHRVFVEADVGWRNGQRSIVVAVERSAIRCSSVSAI